jgi:sporulation protein YlmC with PRC-barrel domain
MKPFDSLGAAGAKELMRRPVVDIKGRKAGTLEYVRIDPSTHRVEFVGLKTGAGLGNVNVVPARVVELKRTAEQAKIREDEHERRHGG